MLCCAAVAVACASIWLAYGLFLGLPSLIFMMAACVVVTFVVLFTAELLSFVSNTHLC